MIQSRRFKILFFSHYTELYGANRSLLNLAEGLRSLYGMEVLVIVPASGDLVDALAKKGIPYRIIPFYNEIFYGSPTTFISKVNIGLRSIIKFLINRALLLKYSNTFKEYDIVHSNSSATLAGAYLARKLKKPHVWHIREFGWEDYQIRYNFGIQYFERWLNRASAVVGVSQAIYKERIENCKSPMKRVVYNGVISQKELATNIERLRENNTMADHMIFGIVGTLAQGKNVLEAIEAFQMLNLEYPNARLWIVGAGNTDYVNKLEAYVEEHDLKTSVSFLGYRESVTDIYSAINCLLMCSRMEALGRVTIEALSLGVPVIGYNGGGTIEIIEDGYNGILYHDGPEHLFKKMKFLIENPGIMTDLSNNAAGSVGRFTIEQYTNEITSVYNQIA